MFRVSTGRYAGHGMAEERYNEEREPIYVENRHRVRVGFNDPLPPEGEVTRYTLTQSELGELRDKWYAKI